MPNDETYEGSANRETWAFNLHWQNDEGMYRETLEYASERLQGWSEMTDYALGDLVVKYWQEYIRTYQEETGHPLPEAVAMFRDEVGSWWRIDETEVGEAVRESLEAEGT